MDLQLIGQFFNIAQGVVWVFGIPLFIYMFIMNGRKDDGEKITNTEKTDMNLAAKIDLTNLEIRHLTEAILLIKQNDLHSITEKQRDQDSQIGKMTISIEKLATIIEERVPRKTVEVVS